jgi:quinol monooxygenase YgiN
VAPAARAQGGTDAVFAVTYLDVGAGAVPPGLELLKKYRDQSGREGANLEFTLLQETSRPSRFVIMEGWRNQAAFEAHDKGAAKSEFEGALEQIRNSPPDRKMLQPFANASARRIEPGALYMVEHVDFMGGGPAVGAAAAPLVKSLAQASQREAGALRYDIDRMPPPPINHEEVVAAGTDAKAFDAHETAAHTLDAPPLPGGARQAGQSLRPAPLPGFRRARRSVEHFGWGAQHVATLRHFEKRYGHERGAWCETRYAQRLTRGVYRWRRGRTPFTT